MSMHYIIVEEQKWTICRGRRNKHITRNVYHKKFRFATFEQAVTYLLCEFYVKKYPNTYLMDFLEAAGYVINEEGMLDDDTLDKLKKIASNWQKSFKQDGSSTFIIQKDTSSYYIDYSYFCDACGGCFMDKDDLMEYTEDGEIGHICKGCHRYGP